MEYVCYNCIRIQNGLRSLSRGKLLLALLLSLSMIVVWRQGAANALVMVGSNGRNYLIASKQDSLLWSFCA